MWLKTNEKKPNNNQIINFTINNINVLITSIDNKLFAIKDLCPHEEIKISLGCIKNNRLKCSLHGFSFDLFSGECDNKDVDNLITYPIKEEHGSIWIKI